MCANIKHAAIDQNKLSRINMCVCVCVKLIFSFFCFG